jgi:hypothetical protein
VIFCRLLLIGVFVSFSAGIAKADLILAGQFTQAAATQLDAKFLSIDSYIATSLNPFLTTRLGAAPPSYSVGTYPGSNFNSAGAALQSSNLLAAGQFTQTAASQLDAKFLSIDSYIATSLNPFLTTRLGTAPPSYSVGTYPGGIFNSAGAALQSSNLLAAGQFTQTAASQLDAKFLSIDSYIATSLNPFLTTRLGTAPPSYSVGTYPGNNFNNAGIQLQAVPEPSSMLLTALLGAIIANNWRTKGCRRSP